MYIAKNLGSMLAFPSSQNGPALSNTPLAKNQVGFITVGPNAVNACCTSSWKVIHQLCDVIRLGLIHLGV